MNTLIKCTDKIDTRLSYSSASLLQSCTMKYLHYKVLGTANDDDYEQDSKAFDVGKAFHFVLEKNLHTKENLEKLLDEACTLYKCTDEKPILHAMLLKYLKVHKKSGLECVVVEQEISTDKFLGYIDAIMIDRENEEYWIVDLKTASSYSLSTVTRLHNDTQLNLYAYFSLGIKENFGLDDYMFKGCRYRVTTKSKLKQKETETYNSFVKRCFDNIQSYDVIIYKESMHPLKAMDKHLKLWQLSQDLRSGAVRPMCNYKACDEYFRTCQYYSRCHGSTFTELKEKLEVITAD